MPESCQTCKKTSPEVSLKRCAKCSTTQYCSRDCQKADWKSHRKICGKAGANESSSSQSHDGSSRNPHLSPPKGLDAPILNPFTRLDNNTWLHDRSETDVYKILIDAYRLRVEDDYLLKGEIQPDSLYAGAKNGLFGFIRFLNTVTSSGLLPAWWTPEKAIICQKLGMDSSQWHSLSHAVEKSDIIDHYGDARFPMQLRMFAEAATGIGPGGFGDAKRMRELMMAAERGEVANPFPMF